jgi:hypothetical protein
MSRGSSVSIVTDYRLNNWAIKVRSPADFSSNPCVQTSSGAHPASWGPFPRAKARSGHDADYSPPHLVPRSRMSRLYTSSPPKRLRGVLWDCFSFFSLLSKNETGLIKSPACLSVCPPLITFEPIGGFSWNLVGTYCQSRWPRRHIFLIS